MLLTRYKGILTAAAIAACAGRQALGQVYSLNGCSPSFMNRMVDGPNGRSTCGDFAGAVELQSGAPEKTVLAWWLRQEATVSLRWVSERLALGHYTRVTQAVSRMGRRPGRKLKQISRQLARWEAKETNAT